MDTPARSRDAEALTRRRAQTRRRILRAAAEVFSRKSVPEATVEDVLQAAGVSRRTFYQLFSDKVDLLAAVYARSIENLHAARLEATARKGSGIDRILAGFDVYLDFQRSAGAVVRVLASEALRPESPLRPMRRDVIEATAALYAERYAEAEGRRLDLDVLRALVLMSEALGLHELSGDVDTPEDFERLRSTLHRIVRGAIEGDAVGIRAPSSGATG